MSDGIPNQAAPTFARAFGDGPAGEQTRITQDHMASWLGPSLSEPRARNVLMRMPIEPGRTRPEKGAV